MNLKIKSLCEKVSTKKPVIFASTLAITCGSAISAHAVGTADPDVVSSFTQLGADAVATVKGVALIGVGIMGVFLLWKYGKKIFNKVAN